MNRFLATVLTLMTAGVCHVAAQQTLPPLPWPVPHLAAPNTPGGNQVMMPLQPDRPTVVSPPPLFYVRLEGPAGSHVTFFRDNVRGEKLNLPAVVGFRPGFIFRFAVSGIPDRPGVVYFPTLEVRGSMVLPVKLRNADHPATINFSVEELDKAAAGTLVHKVIVLERPDKAMPFASSISQPLEVPVPSDIDLFTEARERGMPLAYFFLGQRKYSVDEIRADFGTVYLPGDKSLPMPRSAPHIPFKCYPLIDPNAGPIHPAEYISVYDGGDSALPAGIDRNGKLRGVDPSDTVAEYVDGCGRRRVALSNRVALCIPRFILLKVESTPYVRATARGAEAALALKGLDTFMRRQELVEASTKLQLEVARTRVKASSLLLTYATTVAGSVQGSQVKATVVGPETVDSIKTLMRPEECDLPLLIIKWPDRMGAVIGDVLTFYLKYTNQNKQHPINDVVVVDNLAPRFEYVPGTAKTDRDATFTFQPNQAGSSLLRWEFTSPLLAGESGLISFQVRIR